uniref:Rhodanese domain-containing protein n=1 Tax=Esox lucius TaxID=8010 RepID=A0A3P8Z1W0_ESOLU
MVLVAYALWLLALPLVVVTTETHCSGAPDPLCNAKPGAKYKEPPTTDSEVSYKELKELLSSGSVQLFDVRNPDEFKAGHIPDSTNVPLGELQEALELSPDQFRQRYGVRVPDKEDGDIVVYCQRGRRSATALDIMWALGFSRARHYPGGYSAWVQHEEGP